MKPNQLTASGLFSPTQVILLRLWEVKVQEWPMTLDGPLRVLWSKNISSKNLIFTHCDMFIQKFGSSDVY